MQARAVAIVTVYTKSKEHLREYFDSILDARSRWSAERVFSGHRYTKLKITITGSDTSMYTAYFLIKSAHPSAQMSPWFSKRKI